MNAGGVTGLNVAWPNKIASCVASKIASCVASGISTKITSSMATKITSSMTTKIGSEMIQGRHRHRDEDPIRKRHLEEAAHLCLQRPIRRGTAREIDRPLAGQRRELFFAPVPLQRILG